MSPKTGRPKMTENEKKSCRLEIRLTNKEEQMLTALAKKLNLSKTETIIKALSFFSLQQ